ncbi:hypothetical protein TNCV_430661 [Trichonephila clavipes]|nr:hypothetical protein TNCV_430661 [Trichonephila clavipes]
MVSLGHPSLPPSDLGRLDDEEASPGVRPLQSLKWNVYGHRRNFSEIVCFFCESDTDYHVPPALSMLAFPPSSQHAPGASAFWQCLDRLPRRR